MNANFLILLIAFNSGLALAQKSPSQDHAKAMEIVQECERIKEWRLVKEANQRLEIKCAEDNRQFLSRKKFNLSPGPLRLGNFNLLHPGEDKTLFKDFALVADLVNSEFDVMAGVEFVNVVADAKKTNDKLGPFLEEKFLKVADAQKATKEQESKFKKLQEELKDSQNGSSEEGDKLKALINGLEAKNKEFIRALEENQKALDEVSSKIELNSKPGLVIFGFELFKGARLKRLAEAQEEKKSISIQREDILKAKIAVEREMGDARTKLANTKPGMSEADKLKLLEAETRLNELKSAEEKEWNNYKQYSKAYRIPGYLMLLEKLQDIDPSWSLVVSSMGDAAGEDSTQELVGFYFRASKVKLGDNIHCSRQFSKDSSACTPNFFADYMEVDYANVFSRRPFMATFNNGKSNFTMLAAHVIFTAAYPEEEKKEILKKVFGTDNLSSLGKGISKDNYARFVETEATLKMIDKLRAEGVEKIIYTGDFNLEANNDFWKKIEAKHPGMNLLVEAETSISETRFSGTKETGGTASNYDHFIVGEEENQACKNADRVNFVTNAFSQKIKDKYQVRVDAAKGPYQLSSASEALISARKKEMEERLNILDLVFVKNEVKPDPKLVTGDLANFQERVFDSQLVDKTYYKLFVQLISDHLPIKMECNFE